jgi:hypothetical protein
LDERAQERNNNTHFSEKTQPFFFHTLFPVIFAKGMRALLETNKEKKLGRHMPSLKQLQPEAEEAKKLPQKAEY